MGRHSNEYPEDFLDEEYEEWLDELDNQYDERFEMEDYAYTDVC
ncbi:MAG: hypothetical protein ACO390_17675 [bacterium]